MTKAELIKAVSEKTGKTQTEAKKYIDTTIEVIRETLENGENVSIVGFGNFEVRHRDGHMGRNPATGEAMEIAPSNTVGFKASKVLKEALNA